MIKTLSSLSVILSVSISNHFGSSFTITNGNPSLTDHCMYTQTAGGDPITYLDLIGIAARSTLDPERYKGFLTQLSSVIAQQDADPNWGMDPYDHEPFYNALMLINGYSDISSYRFQQQDPRRPDYERYLLSCDRNYGVALLQIMTLRAKNRF